MLKKIGIGILAVIALILVAFFVYVGDYYKPDEVATAVYEENGKSLEFVGENKEYGFIIYPGGKVDEVAYTPLAKLLNDEGYTSVVASFPFNIGFLGLNKAEDIIAKYPDVENWVIIGHSLGGVSGAVYANENPDEVDGLVFLSSYSTEDLKCTEIKVLSIKASNDTVLNEPGYQEALVNYNEEINNFTEIMIEGGNHAGYGNYGDQKGDGVNEIGHDVQQQIVKDNISEFLTNINTK